MLSHVCIVLLTRLILIYRAPEDACIWLIIRSAGAIHNSENKLPCSVWLRDLTQLTSVIDMWSPQSHCVAARLGLQPAGPKSTTARGMTSNTMIKPVAARTRYTRHTLFGLYVHRDVINVVIRSAPAPLQLSVCLIPSSSTAMRQMQLSRAGAAGQRVRLGSTKCQAVDPNKPTQASTLAEITVLEYF